ncbi:MAG: hypothetical protein ETSY2_35805 [Candidatus Entotheonella gemina]|uniref:Fe/B12 periplasmic-binding domain-containing protein n=1 Tax=Candidatus Entotheonella gemina TaxID=1429439 RepID=W4LX34_9BACT|nr:MAG: hypothetical protein ETSY2_35805 [Candidatus Entotheonella gemina]
MPTARTFTDTMGRTVRLPRVPQRIVSLVPSITEVLFAFGCGDRVVGITDYCTEPAAEVVHKPRVGGTKNPDVPAILEMQPQLVLAVAEENRQHDVGNLTQRTSRCMSLSPPRYAPALICCGGWQNCSTATMQ